MKEKLKSVADELREDLERCPDVRAQELIDLDESLAVDLENYTKVVPCSQIEEWRRLRGEIDQLREFAQVLKMRLLFGDKELVTKLETLHTELSDEMEARAAIEVEREAHEAKGIRDVFKALLMWKDSPAEKLSE